MAAAYLYAEGGSPIPDCLGKLRYIDRFGAKAVTGRDTLGGYEMRMMILAENVVNAYRSRQAASGKEGGWAKWAQDNKDAARLLDDAARMAEELEG